MYQPKRYQKNTDEFAKRLIRENPFAEFVLLGNRLLATHIPILIDEEAENLRLYAHIANHNPQKEYIKDGKEALIIFRGPDAYVSSSWYAQKDISTWDYSAVHISCRLRIQDAHELVESLKKLVQHFEKDQKQPLGYDQIPHSILEDNLSQITGFWCEPILIEGIGKWHQGFSEKEVRSIVYQLKHSACPNNARLINDIKEEHDLRD